MEPVPAMEAAFPFRDPKDPLARVHPRFADESGAVAAKVSVTQASLATGYRTYLKQLAASDAHGRLAGMSAAQVKAAMDSMENDVLAEMIRLIAGEMPEVPRIEPKLLGTQDVQAHEQVLIGRYGLNAVEVPPEEQPTLRNGRILGLYLGALVEDDDALADYHRDHPQALAYEMDVTKRSGQLVAVSALGAANATAFANTAIKAGTEAPEYDHARINAVFIPFDLSMTDKDGRRSAQTIMALVALDNLYASDNPDRQVRVDYGDKYLEQFAQATHAAPESPDVYIKMEI
jgi:hypothetical protein